MDPLVVLAMLGASLLHAGWHALVKSSGDRVVALAGMNLVSGAVALAFVPLVRVPSGAVLGVIAGSIFLHAGYKIALARLYTHADLGQAYPIARGITPILATVLGMVILGDRPDAARWVGILLVSAGIAGLVYERRAPLARATVIAALAAGAAVAAYSVVDALGVRMNGDWLGFTVWLVACDSLLFVAYALATRRGAALAAWHAGWGKTLVSGALGVASFGVFMWALGRAQVGAVTALRETSVMFAALLGVALLGERASAGRYTSAAAVTAGVMVIALYR